MVTSTCPFRLMGWSVEHVCVCVIDMQELSLQSVLCQWLSYDNTNHVSFDSTSGAPFNSSV